jgi:Ran GTPase-activating protein (RanGAP) involved in mRNA processing and transport
MTMVSVPIPLRFGGPRTEMSVAEATECILECRRFMRSIPGAFVHTLDLSCRKWPLSTLEDEAIAPFLEEISTTVVILKLDDIIAGLETDEGFATLAFLARTFRDSPVEELCLNDNALGTRGFEILRDLISRAQRLYLENTGIAEKDAASLREIVDTSRLTALSTGRNQMSIGGAQCVGAMLATSQNLVSFNYKGSRPLSEGTTHLCQGLATLSETNHGVVYLNLHDGMLINDASVDFLVTFLKNSPHLQTLILRDCELKSSDVVKILNALEGAHLAVLDLGGNDQVGEVAQELGAFLKRQVFSLQELHVDTCELTQEGLACILVPFTGYETSLKKLVLDENGIDQAAGKVLLINRIKSLEFLSLMDNTELPLQYAKQLDAMYPTVERDEDGDLEEVDEDELEDEDDDLGEPDEDELADLAEGMGSLRV